MGAKELYEELKIGGWTAVESWVQQKMPESLHLEFKTKKDRTKVPLDTKDSEDLAKGLSGFANTEGGLYIIGLRTNRGATDDEPDVLSRAEEIVDVNRFAGMLEKHLRDYTNPVVAGMDYLVVENPSKSGEGIVAVLVPESTGGPHRAANATTAVNDRYFVRISTFTKVMPHALLEDAFGRRPQPKLRLVVRLHVEAGSSWLSVDLKNVGRGTARLPALRLELEEQRMAYWSAQVQPGWRQLNYFGKSNGMHGVHNLLCQADANVSVFPGLTLPVSNLAPEPSNVSFDGLTLSGVLFAVDARPVEFSGIIRMNQDVLMPDIE